MINRFCGFGLFALAFVAGCSGSDSGIAASGKVTLDGAPLPTGTITFRPSAGGTGRAAGGPITDGKFALPVEPGDYDVLVQASKPSGQEVKGMGATMVESIPKKYNSETTLKAKVGKDSREFDFPLQSK